MNYVAEIAQHPKTQAGATGLIAGANAAIAESWDFSDPNFIMSIVGLSCTVLITFLAWKKSRREKLESDLRIKVLEKQLKENADI